MIVDYSSQIKIVSKRDQDQLLYSVRDSAKYTLIVLLMLDSGLRVTEVARLQIKNFDFKGQQVVIPSLKKRSEKPVYRTVPLTRRTYDALADWYITLKDKSSEAWLFPSVKSVTGHIERKGIHKIIYRRSNRLIAPHDLRHTFATKIVASGNDISVAQDLLGHASRKTTEIYLHVPEHEKRRAIKSIDKISIITRLKDRLIKPKQVFKLNHISDLTSIYVGRKEELSMLSDLYLKRVNTIVTGPQGIGKSELIKQLSGDKILRLDDFSGVKKTLGNILLYLYKGDKDKVISLLTSNADIMVYMQKETSARLIELIGKAVEPQEYTLIIDDLTNVTKGGITVLEKLKNIFHIVAAARRIKVNQGSFLTNFQKLEVKPLKRHECTNLIVHLSSGMRDRIADFETYKNHIYEQTGGIPLFIYELVDRFSKESEIDTQQIRDISHTAAAKEIDMSVPLIVGVSSLMILRYIGGEFDDDSGAFKLFGGAFMLFALFGRQILNLGKRRYV